MLLVLALALASPTQATPGKLTLEARDGTLRHRSLAGWSSEGWAESDAIALRFEGLGALESGLADAGLVAWFTLANGDRVRGAVVGGAGDRLDVRLAGAVPLPLDVEELRELVFPARADESAQRGFAAPEHGDRLYWLRGKTFDRVDGTVEEFASEGLVFDSVLGKKLFPWREVGALFIETLADPSAKRLPMQVCVELADGGRLRGSLGACSETRIQLALDERRALELPLAAISELVRADGSVAFLSELRPARATEGWLGDDEPGMRWPFRVDRAVAGGPLLVGGQVYPRGFGVHAPSRLEFELDGSWKTLRGAVAIDDSVLLLPYRGSVEFSITLGASSEPAWRSGRVRGGEAPVALPALDLNGVHTIALEVSMDERFFVADRAAWLRMLLVR